MLFLFVINGNYNTEWGIMSCRGEVYDKNIVNNAEHMQSFVDQGV